MTWVRVLFPGLGIFGEGVKTKGSYEFSHERVTCGLSGRENDVAGTCEGHVRAKSVGDEVVGSREGSRGCKWDMLAF